MPERAFCFFWVSHPYNHLKIACFYAFISYVHTVSCIRFERHKNRFVCISPINSIARLSQKDGCQQLTGHSERRKQIPGKFRTASNLYPQPFSPVSFQRHYADSSYRIIRNFHTKTRSREKLIYPTWAGGQSYAGWNRGVCGHLSV